MSYIDLDRAISNYNMNVTGVIHAGGHYGEEYHTYKNISTISDIVFFEPDESSFVKLKETTSHDNRVTCFKTGLGPFSGSAKFYRSTDCEGQANSTLEPLIVRDIYPSIKFTETSTIEIETLDSYNFSPNYNLLNMDVQGGELNILLGATDTLKRIQYVLTEVNTAELYRNCALIEDLDYFLGKFRFKRVETGLENVTQAWGDALYIKI
jgi:FkbM family methyltransferase